MIEIDEPVQLLAAFPQHVLKISSQAHALRRWTKELNDHTPPEDELLIRYESDVNMLYVDALLFKKYNMEELSKKLRLNDQYQGAVTKRMFAGIEQTGKTSVRALIFDLNRQSIKRDSLRDVMISQRREKRDALMSDAMDSLSFINKAVSRIKTRRKQAQEHFNALKEGAPLTLQEKREFLDGMVKMYEEMELLLARSRFVLSEAHEIVETMRIRKKSKRVDRSATRVDRVPMAERRRIKALDKLIQIENQNLHKMRHKWEPINGMLTKVLKEKVPDCDPTDISGMYVEKSSSDGSNYKKDLFIPVAVIRNYLLKDNNLMTPAEKAELAKYKYDMRYVSVRATRIGGKVQRSVYFDMTRSENIVNKLDKEQEKK